MTRVDDASYGLDALEMRSEFARSLFALMRVIPGSRDLAAMELGLWNAGARMVRAKLRGGYLP